MAEYIDREELVRQIICSMGEFIGAPDDVQKHDEQCNYAINVIEDSIVADVAPVVHGRWDDEHKCTVCHNEAFYKISNIRPDYDYDWEENLVETGDYIWDTEWIETAYCPNCGAKMDGGDSDEVD